MEFRAVIFDLDGVLVHTDKYHYQAWKEIAKELGIEFSEKDNDGLRGISRAESLEMILKKYSGEGLTHEKKEELINKKNNIYVELLKNMTGDDVSIDVRKTLSELRNRGIRLAVGSSSKNTPYILKQTDLEDSFDEVADGNIITRSKPDPEVFLKAAELLSENPEDCIVVEDADAGIEAARAAGMHTVAIGAAAKSGMAEVNIIRISDILSL